MIKTQNIYTPRNAATQRCTDFQIIEINDESVTHSCDHQAGGNCIVKLSFTARYANASGAVSYQWSNDKGTETNGNTQELYMLDVQGSNVTETVTLTLTLTDDAGVQSTMTKQVDVTFNEV